MKNTENIDELFKIPIEHWARIYCELNAWIWPVELEHIKPEYFDLKYLKVKMYEMIDFSHPLMEIIKKTIGEKAVSKEWNKGRMTDEEFELFWCDKMTGRDMVKLIEKINK